MGNEFITCRGCENHNCVGCNIYTLEKMLMNGVFDDMLDKRYAIVPEAIKDAFEKQKPKRLKETTSTKRCPSCNKQITAKGCIHGNYHYCRWCGQAIDWSDGE